MTADRVTINPIAVMDSPADQKPRRTKITPADRGSSPALAKTFTLTVDRLTFEEAAQSAYLEKNKLGFEYRIVSIRDTGV